MRALWNGEVIGDSERTVEVAGYRYFPREEVRMNRLKKVAKTASDKECPHGVQFYDVGDGKKTSARAAWSYEKPLADYKHIDHWIGFWEDVELVD